jgi:glucosyl-3-phosphoglycerate synthase
MPSLPTLTLAVVGHNEAQTLDAALDQAMSAAGRDDVVCFVDSASSDESVAMAAGRGVNVIRAPLGKGRAVGFALARCQTDFIVVIDGDIHASSMNIPMALRQAVIESGADMVVGDFVEPDDPVLSNTVAVYEPLVASLVPEAARRFGSKPLTGFRAWRTDLPVACIPRGFGLEAHLNIVAALNHVVIEVADIGRYTGRFMHKPTMGLEIAEAVLDAAEDRGRLDPLVRPLWEQWVQPAVGHIANYHGGRTGRGAFIRELRRLADRPLPPTQRE